MRSGIALLLVSAASCAGPGVRFQPSAVGAVVLATRDVGEGRGFFTEYRVDGGRGPVLWPLCASSGEPVTRSYPFAEVDGESRDHPHHESCWFAHGDVDGVDCWAGDGAVVAVGPLRIAPGQGEIVQGCDWRDGSGRPIAREVRSWRFAARGGVRTVDVEVRMRGVGKALRIGDTKKGTMALRLRREFSLPEQGGEGHLFDSEGREDGGVWGKRARWVACATDLDGRRHTVALFDAPDNHGHPTFWHARGYGLLAANPFGRHAFAGDPPGSGDLVVAPGDELRLRYRIWICVGACDASRVEAAWREFARR